ncbi:MAG: undecaprenyldiphospho-muramoylpentapeptide beta-N-acetylglucosaminyltransferase [Acidobacteriia bacterium]|nr:undecaprenyldiphospho-muramoylpentapeptide beta-N-acetylglucosaminyltransferase [Terriglobia bacterium]
MTERSEQPSPGPRPPAPGPFLLSGGGTGGHVIPALAVARELRTRGHEVFFVGTERGLEAKLVPAEGFELKTIDIGGLNRVGLRQKLATLARLPFTTAHCARFVRRASAVFSMGGYVAGPPVLAALLWRVPVVVMEPNAVPGFTNRAIGRLVARALISFPETAAWFPKGRTEATGLPVREEFFRIRPRARGETLNILITGGSQGSRRLNQAARRSWALFRGAGLPVRLVHQTGPAGFEQLRDDFAASGLEGETVPFITDMPAAFAAADLVVCRAGAGAVSELAAAGKPSILVPFPFAADDHQTRNAEALERAGAARLVRDAEMDGEKLFAAVAELARTSGALERMGEAARQFARPGAARRAAEILEEVARRA